ncbi:hypothetical protein [Acidovorax carolinensis]|uniref:hypothetical protein n=1 Tax=Acidovorax carolinensis TaxID=553814 RepID=UPI001F1B35AF|nr:hypothetical protein [Acidovorax carolinensis]
MRDQALQITDVVACTGPGTKSGAADVHRIGAVVHGLNANIGVAGRGEQFDLVGQQGHGGDYPSANCRVPFSAADWRDAGFGAGGPVISKIYTDENALLVC